MALQDSWKGSSGQLGEDFWKNYHKTGIIPNLWKGFTGQLSSEIIADETNKINQSQFEESMNLANEQLDFNKRVADQNFKLQQEQFDYQKLLNQTQMEREDSAYQRAIADAQKAGFSPLAVSGGASSAPLTSSSAPQYDTSGVNTSYGAKQDAYRRKLEGQLAVQNMKFNAWQSHKQTLLQTAGLAQNLASMHYDNQLKREEIKTKEYENAYYEKHGYRLTDLATVMSDFLNSDGMQKLLSNMGSLGDKLADGVQKGITALRSNGSNAPVYDNAQSFVDSLDVDSKEKRIMSSAVRSVLHKELKDCDLTDLLNAKVIRKMNELRKLGR